MSTCTEKLQGAPAGAQGSTSPRMFEERCTLTEESVTAVFSSRHREGRWDSPDDIQVRAIFGEVKLDFTRAELPPSGVVELDVQAVFGDVEITVPDGAEVELDGTPVFGSIERKRRDTKIGDRVSRSLRGERHVASDRRDPEAPLFYIDGHAVFGSIRVISF